MYNYEEKLTPERRREIKKLIDQCKEGRIWSVKGKLVFPNK